MTVLFLYFDRYDRNNRQHVAHTVRPHLTSDRKGIMGDAVGMANRRRKICQSRLARHEISTAIAIWMLFYTLLVIYSFCTCLLALHNFEILKWTRRVSQYRSSPITYRQVYLINPSRLNLWWNGCLVTRRQTTCARFFCTHVARSPKQAILQ